MPLQSLCVCRGHVFCFAKEGFLHPLPRIPLENVMYSLGTRGDYFSNQSGHLCCFDGRRPQHSGPKASPSALAHFLLLYASYSTSWPWQDGSLSGKQHT